MPDGKKEMTGYELSRNWFNWCYENPEKINPNHTAMYFFIIEHWNRMGQKEKFGLPTQMTMDGMGVKNYKTHAKVFKDLIEWGFVKLIQKSENQYSTNIIAIVKNTKSHTKSLTKASLNHLPNQVQTIVDIDKPINIEPIIISDESQKKYSQDEILSFKKFNDWISINAPRVNKLKEPFVIDEYLKLTMKISKVKLTDLLVKMHNYKPLLTKNVSAYLTVLNWHGRQDDFQPTRERKEFNSAPPLKIAN